MTIVDANATLPFQFGLNYTAFTILDRLRYWHWNHRAHHGFRRLLAYLNTVAHQASRLVMPTRNTGLFRSASSISEVCEVLAGSYSRHSQASDSGRSMAPCAIACRLVPK